MGMRFIIALVLGGALALVGCGSDSDSGSNGGNGADPEITDVAWTAAAACSQGVSSDVEIVVTASDPDSNPADLVYRGDVSGCTGAIDAATSTINCPNVLPYPGTVVVTDPEGHDSTVTFRVPVCASGSCTEDPTSCSL
jgi:hypothetical protein